jgi:hypothetical protein
MLSINAVLYRMRPITSAGRYATLCGARPIQLFEGSRPWGGIYAKSMASACYLGLAVDLQKVVIVFLNTDTGVTMQTMRHQIVARMECLAKEKPSRQRISWILRAGARYDRWGAVAIVSTASPEEDRQKKRLPAKTVLESQNHGDWGDNLSRGVTLSAAC